MNPRRFAVLLLVSCSLLAEANAATVTQNDDYLYTMVRDSGVRSRTDTRQVSERRMEKLSQRMPAKMARMQARYEARAARGRGCDAGAGSGDQASLMQSGDRGVASLTQLGGNDSLTVSQTGMDDAAYALQLGNNHATAIDQNGNHDLAVVIQRCHPTQGWAHVRSEFLLRREAYRADEDQ